VYRLFLKKYAVPIGHGNSFFGHGKVMENRCCKRVVTLMSTKLLHLVRHSNSRLISLPNSLFADGSSLASFFIDERLNIFALC